MGAYMVVQQRNYVMKPIVFVERSASMDFCNCDKEKNEKVLAMGMIPVQPWETPYAPDVALDRGTIFPKLDLPFYVADELTGGVMRV